MPYENWVALQYRNLKTMEWETIQEYPESVRYLADSKLNAQPDDFKRFYQVIVIEGTGKRLGDLQTQYSSVVNQYFMQRENRMGGDLLTELCDQAQTLLDEICDIKQVDRIAFSSVVANFDQRAKELHEQRRKDF